MWSGLFGKINTGRAPLCTGRRSLERKHLRELVKGPEIRELPLPTASSMPTAPLSCGDHATPKHLRACSSLEGYVAASFKTVSCSLAGLKLLG